MFANDDNKFKDLVDSARQIMSGEEEPISEDKPKQQLTPYEPTGTEKFKSLVESVSQIMSEGGPFDDPDWTPDGAPAEVTPAGKTPHLPAPGVPVLLILAMFAAGTPIWLIALILGLSIAVVGDIVNGDNTPTPTTNPSSKPRGEPTDGGSTPTGIWPPSKQS